MKRTDLFVLADEFGANIEKLIDVAKINNFHRIVISANESIKLSEFSINDSQEIKKKLDDAQLGTWAISSQIGKISILDDFDSHIDQLKNILKVANILNTDNIIINSFFIPQYISYNDVKNEIVERLGKIIEICLKAGIYPILENAMGTFTENNEQSLIIYNELPMVKGLFNISEGFLAGDDVTEAWNRIKKHIAYLRIGNIEEWNIDIDYQKNIENIKCIIKDYILSNGKRIIIKTYDFSIIQEIIL